MSAFGWDLSFEISRNRHKPNEFMPDSILLISALTCRLPGT
jgi:hypothetical protein